MYDTITIFLIVLGLFFVGLFLLFCFLPREISLAFAVKLVWKYWILITLDCLQSFDFSLGRVFLVVGSSFFISLNIFCHSFLACRVSVEKSVDNLMEVPLCCLWFSPGCFQCFILPLIFVSLIAICFDVFLLQFILPGLSALPGLDWLFPFPCLGSFQLSSLQIFSQVLSLSLVLLEPL